MNDGKTYKFQHLEAFYLCIEQKTVEITNKSTSNMLKIQLQLIKNFGHKQQTIDPLLLNQLNSYFIIDDSNINLSVLGLPLEPWAS